MYFALTRGGLCAMRGPGLVAVARFREDRLETGTKHEVRILCANDRFLVFRGSVNSPWPTTVLDRRSQRLQALTIPGASSDVRIFGSWLAVRVAEPNPQHRISPGSKDRRKSSGSKMDVLPPVDEFYSEPVSPAMDRYFPGDLRLINLDNGKTFDIKTGQGDSQVLYADDDKVLYRVNRQIFQTRAEGDHLAPLVPIAEDENVSEIHWLFWGP